MNEMLSGYVTNIQPEKKNLCGRGYSSRGLIEIIMKSTSRNN